MDFSEIFYPPCTSIVHDGRKAMHPTIVHNSPVFPRFALIELMDIQENISLGSHSTMRLGGNARYLSEAHSEKDVEELVSWAKLKNVPFMMIGQGSNIVWRDEGYPGLIIVNELKGRVVLNEDESSATVKISAGEVWDEVVAKTVENKWSGIEFLSLIPGTAGAAPVQNIGAYGAELSNTLLQVEVFDTQSQEFGNIQNENCGFAYRTSHFKTSEKGRYLITAIVLKLKKSNPAPPFYDTLAKYFEEHRVTEYTPKAVREAVIAIRSSKLPNPAVVANNGSFFTNPIIGQAEFDELKQKYPEIKGWPREDGKVKVAAGWLVEQAGFKGAHDDQTGMATWDKQALVLVNERAKNTADLLAFKQKIIDKVKELFGLTLEQEPELLP
jgi:UDP-N-acetylmuramate dehydrogenase